MNQPCPAIMGRSRLFCTLTKSREAFNRKRSTICMLTSARQILHGARSKNLLRS